MESLPCSTHCTDRQLAWEDSSDTRKREHQRISLLNAVASNSSNAKQFISKRIVEDEQSGVTWDWSHSDSARLAKNLPYHSLESLPRAQFLERMRLCPKQGSCWLHRRLVGDSHSLSAGIICRLPFQPSQMLSIETL